MANQLDGSKRSNQIYELDSIRYLREETAADIFGLQWDGCRKETDYYEKSYGSRRNSNFRDTQVDIEDNSWSVEAGLRTCQNNSSSIRYGGKDISFIRKNGHILRGGERMQVKGLFLNYKKNRRLMQYFFKIRELV